MWWRSSAPLILCLVKLTANPSETAVREELWTSFRSLLQAYLAAGSMGMDVPQVALLEAEAGELQLVGAQRTVKLAFAARSGEGYWAIYTGSAMLDEGAFRLGLDSLLEWSGKANRQEMDAVAEALVTLVLS